MCNVLCEVYENISMKTTSLVKSFTIKLLSRNNSQVIQKFVNSTLCGLEKRYLFRILREITDIQISWIWTLLCSPRFCNTRNFNFCLFNITRIWKFYDWIASLEFTDYVQKKNQFFWTSLNTLLRIKRSISKWWCWPELVTCIFEHWLANSNFVHASKKVMMH